MSIDSPRGVISFFEDFIGLDVVADRPEYAVDTDPAVEVVASLTGAGDGGVVRITMDAAQTNIGGIAFGQTQWSVYDNYLYFEARVRLSATGAASERVFVGLTDVQEDTLTEMPFTGATTILTASGNPDDAVGFFYEGDMTGDYWQPGSVDTDVVVIGTAANGLTALQRTAATLVAATWHTLSFRIDDGATYAEFYVDGELVYTYNSATVITSDVAFIPIFVATEGTGAINADIDYIYVEMGRDN